MAEDQRLDLRDAARARGIASTTLGVAGAALIAAGVARLAIHAGWRAPAALGSTVPRDGGAPVPVRTAVPNSASSASWSLGLSGRGGAVLGRF